MISAITIGVRILGPALGFILGSVCTLLYADLSKNPQILPTDPRWVGAWWLGLVLIAALLMLASVAMFMFPKRLRPARQGARNRHPVASPSSTAAPSVITPLQTPPRGSTPPPRRDKKKNPSLRGKTLFFVLDMTGIITGNNCSEVLNFQIFQKMGTIKMCNPKVSFECEIKFAYF